MKSPMITSKLTGLLAVCVLLFAGPVMAQDHPFTLVNVVDLFELFSISNFDSTFNPVTAAPSNWAAYSAAPRIGTNPACVAVSGDRAFVGGFYNGPNFNRFGDVNANRSSWYAAVGVVEIPNISTQSGFGGNYTRYPGTFQVGPGIQNTDWMSGMDYDPISKRLYIAYDAIQAPFSFIMPDPGLPWQFYQTYIAAVDADPASPTYTQVLWKRTNLTPPSDPGSPVSRVHAGVSIDPLNPNWLALPVQGLGRIAFFDLTNPFGPSVDRFIGDFVALNCSTTAYRGNDFHPVTGEWYGRLLNGIQYVRRDTSSPVAPYKVFSRFIREPSAGGDGTANTTATGDDTQLVNFGDPVSPSQDIIGTGPNGVLDTTPGGDDVLSTSAIVTERVLGNSSGSCPDDPNGFPSGNNPQGQGLAIIPSYNLVAASQDMLVANNRAVFGSNQPTEIKFFDLNGTPIAQLQIPCSPIASATTGTAIYDFDYDPDSGTLVVLEFERRLLYVYKAQRTGDQPYPRYDFTRNRRLDLADFAGLQQNYTGSENPGGLSLNAQRLNTDSDCDLDFIDYTIFQATWDAGTGP